MPRGCGVANARWVRLVRKCDCAVNEDGEHQAEAKDNKGNVCTFEGVCVWWI
jgi:hypothetical protein